MERPFEEVTNESEVREHTTGLRYNLDNSKIGSRDFFVQHISGRVRLMTYPKSDSPERRALARTLVDDGLILGARLNSSTRHEEVFRIPLSARPISYDASSHAQGAFSYGDDRLFYDLGNILGRLQSKNLYLESSIGSSIAFVEYAKPNEQQILFVPGAELLMNPINEEQNSLDHYRHTLREEFGERYADADMYFRMGFHEALTQEEV